MNYETKELNTKRLKLNKGELRDFLCVYEYNFSKLTEVDGVFELEKQDLSKIIQLFGNGVDKYYRKIQKNHIFDWIIYKDNIAIGNILAQNENVNTIELTYNLHPKYWGNNYMPEALEKVMEYLFSIGYDNIICSYLQGNKKAKRVVEKLGFKPYQIKQDSWKSKNGNMIDEFKLIMTKESFLSRTSKINIIND